MAMVDNFSSTDQNPTVNGRVDDPNEHYSTQGPQLAISSNYPLDQPPCSSQQEPMFEKYNPSNNFAIYDMDSSTGAAKFKICDTGFKKIFCKQQKVDLPTKFNEIIHDNLKTPIAKLNEIMLLKKQVVEYKLISVTGHVHNPVFKFTAINNEIQAYGEGFSKKEAKKNAAIDLLDKLSINDGNNTITSTTSNISPSKVSPLKYSEEKVLDEISKVNPIGLLQELCMARHWELPNYEFPQAERDEAHNIWYSVVCSLRDLQSKGKGKTKQAAKRQAAHIMYEQIKNVLEQSISKARENEYSAPSNSILDKMEIQNLDCLNNLKSLEIFFKQLKSSQKPSIMKLRNIDSTIYIKKNAIELLKAVGVEENLKISYILIHKMLDGIGVIIQLTINPILVFTGTGKSIDEAHEMAAFVALSYIKLLIN